MGFSLAALFGFGKKTEPKPPEPPREAAMAAPVAVPVAARSGGQGISALLRSQAAAAARGDGAGAYAGARALAEAYSAQGRMQLSMAWAVEAGELALAEAAAGAGGRPVAARAAAAAALKFVESGRTLASGPHAGVLTRVCGPRAAALMADHGAWLSRLGFSAGGTASGDEEGAGELAA